MNPDDLETLQEWYREAIAGSRAIQDEWDASHPDHPQLGTMRKILDQIKAERETKDEPVTSVDVATQSVFNGSETRSIHILKAEAVRLISLIGTTFLSNDNIVLAGGCFASWFHGEKPKDYDVFIVGPLAEQVGLLNLIQQNTFDVLEDTTSQYVRDNKNIHAVHMDRKRNIQYIFTKYANREELVKNFDLAHTQVSFHMATLYLNRRTFDAIKYKTLEINEGRTVPEWRLRKFVERGWKLPKMITTPYTLGGSSAWTSTVPTGHGGGGGGGYATVMKISDPRSGARVNPMRGSLASLGDDEDNMPF